MRGQPGHPGDADRHPPGGDVRGPLPGRHRATARGRRSWAARPPRSSTRWACWACATSSCAATRAAAPSARSAPARCRPGSRPGALAGHRAPAAGDLAAAPDLDEAARNATVTQLENLRALPSGARGPGGRHPAPARLVLRRRTRRAVRVGGRAESLRGAAGRRTTPGRNDVFLRLLGASGPVLVPRPAY